jgi:galactonate dehydratase
MGPTIDESIEGAERLHQLGWQAIRMTVVRLSADPLFFDPRKSLPLTAELLIKTRERLGREPVIGIEYHHRLSVAEAASFCQMMPSGTIDFLEEPIRDETPEAYETLRTMTDVPFAIGEEFASKWQFLPYIERGITNYARVDVCNVGGFTEAMKVAGWAEAHYIDLMPHNPLGPICIAASSHMGVAVPNFSWLEIRESPTEHSGRYDAEIFPVQPKLEGDKVFLSDRPGLGVEVDEASLEAPFEFSETLHLRREDGSHTNW